MHKDKVYVLNDDDFKKLIKESRTFKEIWERLGFSSKPGLNSRNRIKERASDLDLPFKAKQSVKNNSEKISKNIKPKKLCNVCNKEISSKSKGDLCQECRNNKTYNEKISLWKNGKIDLTRGEGYISRYIQRYLFEKNNNSCELCNWSKINKFTGKIPLQVHHIDGNSENNKEENLQLLCPSCHSLTNNYGGSNRGNGRKNRYTSKENNNV